VITLSQTSSPPSKKRGLVPTIEGKKPAESSTIALKKRIEALLFEEEVSVESKYQFNFTKEITVPNPIASNSSLSQNVVMPSRQRDLLKKALKGGRATIDKEPIINPNLAHLGNARFN
jgi:hypothetical protein